jgi:hypothetical protein
MAHRELVDSDASSSGTGVFPITVDVLRDLIELPREDGAKELAEKYRGVSGIASALKVEVGKGLDHSSASDIALRQATFGRNFIEPKVCLHG